MMQVESLNPNVKIFIPIKPKQFPTIAFTIEEDTPNIIYVERLSKTQEKLYTGKEKFIEIRRFGKLC